MSRLNWRTGRPLETKPLKMERSLEVIPLGNDEGFEIHFKTFSSHKLTIFQIDMIEWLTGLTQYTFFEYLKKLYYEVCRYKEWLKGEVEEHKRIALDKGLNPFEFPYYNNGIIQRAFRDGKTINEAVEEYNWDNYNF